MRILMLTSSWPLSDGDFRGGFVSELAVELAARDILVDVAVPAPADRPEQPGPTVLADGRVVVHWLPSRLPLRSRAFHGDGIENNLLRHPFAAFSIPSTLFAFAAECSLMLPFVDAVVSNWLLPMGAVGAMLSSMANKPHLIIAHSGPPVPALVPPLSTVVRKIVTSSASVACVSESVRRSVSRASDGGSPDKLRVIRLGVPLRPFVENSAAPGAPLHVMFVGRLVSIKGLDILIRAMGRMDGCRLTVVGDGPMRSSMEALAKIMGVDASFAGALPPDGVRAVMCGADVLVVPSRRGVAGREEGLPRVIGEAWAVGLPVVASRSGGMEEAIGGSGAGLLFEPGDVGSLRSLLHGLVNDRPALYAMRREAMRAAVALSWENMGARWASWIESALNGQA